jgi:hypothetical protein
MAILDRLGSARRSLALLTRRSSFLSASALVFLSTQGCT